MKNYQEPIINEEAVELEDIIAVSLNGDTLGGSSLGDIVNN